MNETNGTNTSPEGKRVFHTELAYIFGLLILTLGTALVESADFGVSMVVAPAYILHLKISEYLPFFSFGMAEYTLQAFLIIAITVIMRRFRLSYLFSFVTAVLYGVILDLWIMVIGGLGELSMAMRIVNYCLGVPVSSLGVSLFFHTYISPEAYELFVAEVSSKTRINLHKFKTGYDLTSLIVSVILSFIFFGFGVFRGIHIGTVVCALVNGFIISRCTRLLEHFFVFEDGLKLRPLFEK